MQFNILPHSFNITRIILAWSILSIFGCGQNSVPKNETEESTSTPSLAILEHNDFKITNGKYCAEVWYVNKQSGTNSNYSLLVDVQNEKVVCIYWPQGGHLDTDHFTASAIPEEGKSVINTYDGKIYEVLIVGPESACNERFEGQLHQCKGLTKKGNRCKRMTDNENGYCFQHQNQ
jgi:hypothetical protein